MKRVKFGIQGVSPLLMHRFPEEGEDGGKDKTKKEQARNSMYEQKGKPYIPGSNLWRSFVSAANYSKGKGRATLSRPAAAGLLIRDEHLWLDTPWVVDSRPVVNPPTGGRIIRHRAKFEEWKVEGMLEYDEALLTGQEVRKIVDDAGARVGVLDFRPECKGPFGRFMVVKWEAA